MDMVKKEILKRIKELMNQTCLDTKEIEWFRYIMENIKEIDILGHNVWVLDFFDEESPYEDNGMLFRRFVVDYRRDKYDK